MNADDVKLGMRVAVLCEVQEMRLVDDKKRERKAKKGGRDE